MGGRFNWFPNPFAVGGWVHGITLMETCCKLLYVRVVAIMHMYTCEEDEEETRGFIIIYADTSVIPDTAYNGVCRRGGF